MKKSFLITLAAVSSVALIGCSSSSDDKDGNPGPATADATKAEIQHVTDKSAYYGSVITPLKNSNGTALTVKVTCETKENEAKVLLGADNLVAVSKDDATTITDCEAELEGEGSDKVQVALDFTKENNEKGHVFTVKNGDTEQTDKIALTKDTDSATTYNVTATIGGSIALGKDGKTPVLTKGGDFADFTIDASAELKDGDTNAIFTKDDTKKTFTLDPNKATTSLTDKAVEFKGTNDQTKLGEILVDIKVPVPALILDEANIKLHASDTAHILIPVKTEFFDGTIQSFDCKLDKDGADARAGFAACDSDLTIKGNTTKTGIYVDAAKAKALLEKNPQALVQITAKAAESSSRAAATIEPLVLPVAQLGEILQPKVFVFDVAPATREAQPLTSVDVSDTTGKEVNLVANKTPLVAYTATDDQVGSKKEYTNITFNSVALKTSSDAKFELAAGTTGESCLGATDESSAVDNCYVTVKLTAAGAAGGVASDGSVKDDIQAKILASQTAETVIIAKKVAAAAGE